MKNDSKTRIAIGELKGWILWTSTRVLSPAPAERLRGHLQLWMESENLTCLKSGDLGKFIGWLHWAQTHLDNVQARDEGFLVKHLALWEARPK